MAMGGQLHAPAALLPQTELPEVNGGWFAARQCLAPVGNRTRT